MRTRLTTPYDRAVRLCVFVCGAIVLGIVGTLVRTGHVPTRALFALILCVTSLTTGTAYLISRSRSERRNNP